MLPVQVREDDRRQIEGRQRQDAEHRKEEEEIAVGRQNREPVELLEFLNQQRAGGNERCAQQNKYDADKRARSRHGFPLVCALPRPIILGCLKLR
jgi:hypothetical protein